MAVLRPEDMNRQFTEAFNAGRVDELLALYEPDAVLVPSPGAPAVAGPAAIEAALRGLLATGVTLELKGQRHCLVHGDLALLRADFRMRGGGPTGAEPTRPAIDAEGALVEGASSEVVRRQADGTWKYVIDHPFGANPTDGTTGARRTVTDRAADATPIRPAPPRTQPIMTSPPSAEDPIVALLFADLGEELAATRSLLERYPDGRGDWRPHERSMPLQKLATHVAELPRVAQVILETDEWDRATTPYAAPVLATREALLAQFDRHAAALRAAVAAADAAALARPWALRRGAQVFVSGTKAALVRRMSVTHVAHHRGQLTVYYRLLGVSVPGTHGPSGDDA